MAFGDMSYKWLFSGSVTASANTLHNMFGLYNGLSKLNADAVVHLQLQASGADLVLYPTVGADANQAGQWFKQDIDVYQDLPPLRVSDASQFSFQNLTAGDHAVVRWILWVRRSQ